jgi:hypothetical protein
LPASHLRGRRAEQEQRRSETLPASRGRLAEQEQRRWRSTTSPTSRVRGRRAEQEKRRRSQRLRRRAVCEVGERPRCRRCASEPCTGSESRARTAAMVVARLRRRAKRKQRQHRRSQGLWQRAVRGGIYVRTKKQRLDSVVKPGANFGSDLFRPVPVRT